MGPTYSSKLSGPGASTCTLSGNIWNIVTILYLPPEIDCIGPVKVPLICTVMSVQDLLMCGAQSLEDCLSEIACYPGGFERNAN